MNPQEAIQALEQFERLDDYQVAEIVKCINEMKCCGNCKHSENIMPLYDDITAEIKEPCCSCRGVEQWEPQP